MAARGRTGGNKEERAEDKQARSESKPWPVALSKQLPANLSTTWSREEWALYQDGGETDRQKSGWLGQTDRGVGS